MRLAIVAVAALTVSCGGPPANSQIGSTPRAPVVVAEWPPPATSPTDALTVSAALATPDGAQIRVRAYLAAVALPCPACNVGGQRGASASERDRIGKTARPRGPDMPGCAPCPAAAATFSDGPPTASPGPALASLRAVGGAEALQGRHVGHVFLLTGTFHARRESGPELEVSDVRALEDH